MGAMEVTCSVNGCARKSRSRGMCAAHYMRWRRSMNPTPKRQRELQPCGTVAAANRHYRAGEPLCEPCRDAKREDKRARRAAAQARQQPRNEAPVQEELADPDTGTGISTPCQMNPEMWFPDRSGGSVRLAKKFCATCPALNACLRAAMDIEAGKGTHERHGIWAGLSPAERHRMDHERRAA